MNEGERLFLPARSALKRPGSPGWFRGMKLVLTSGSGCFPLFFSSIGILLFTFGLAGTFGPCRDSLRESGDPRFFYAAMAFGFVFFLVPLRMLQIMANDAAGRQQVAEKRTDGPPWKWDYPWKQEKMLPDYVEDTGGSILGRVAFLSLIALFNIALQAPSWLMRGIILLFDLLGLLILVDSIRAMIQRIRFRLPTITWSGFPVAPAGALRAVIEFPRSLQPTGAAELTLRCVKDRWVEGDSGRQLYPFALWSQATTVPVAEGTTLRELRVEMPVPSNLPETNLSSGSGEASYWQLLVRIPIAGPDFETVFLVPVYNPSS